ncbi:SWI/SNF and RSC complex subunit Ssr3 [Blastocladiella emersonii ATCC 22665]|nr:SWI/SNF and RSC complex subunit Ssr3 [Blastocladiella emersonii ATCC 22665]
MSSTQRKKKALERNLPKKVEQIVPESEYYKRLQEAERKIDAVIQRKRLEIQDALAKPIKTRGTLRIFISNYAADQHLGAAEMAEGRVPNWTLRIEGRLIDVQSATTTRSKSAAAPPPRKFTHFVKHIVVEVERDPHLYNESNIVEFLKPDKLDAEFDGFEVKRRGDTDVAVKITMRMDYGPDKFKVSDDLAKVIQFDVGGPNKVGLRQLRTKSQILLGVWQYIKHHNLLDADDKRIVNCDAHLKQIFNTNQILFPQIPDLITRHIFPPDPIVLHYVVKVDQEFTAAQHVYDVEVELDDVQTKSKLHAILTATDNQREIAELDAQISAAIVSLNNHRLKRDFMLAFAKDPVGFLNRFVESQSRDLQIILAGTSVNRSDARRADFYRQPWVRDAIVKYLASKHTSATPAAAAKKRMRSLVYITPWNRAGYDATLAHAAHITHVSPTWHGVRISASTTLYELATHERNTTWLDAIRALPKDARPLVLPRFTLDDWPRHEYMQLIQVRDRAKLLFGLLMLACKEHGYDGAVLEMTNVLPYLVDFIAEASQAFKSEGFRLVLVVPPYHTDQVTDAHSAQAVFGAAAYRKLAPLIEGFSLMTYDYSAGRGEYGPNAPIQWVHKNVERLCLTSCAKLFVGLNFYGMRIRVSPSREAIIDHAPILGHEAAEVAARPGALREWVDEYAEHFIAAESTADDGEEIRELVWYPSPESVAARVGVVEAAGAGVAVWEAGQGTPELWDALFEHVQ